LSLISNIGYIKGKLNTIMTYMTPKFIFCYLFYIIVAIILPYNAIAQSNSPQRSGSNNTSNTFLSPNENAIYYVDDVGLRIAADSPSLEGFIDESTYFLGAKDIISIEIRSTIPVSWRGLVVNAEGYLGIPTVGNIKVADMSLLEAKDVIKEMISKSFRADEIIVILELPKQVHVHIVGDFNYPGRYAFPANSRLDQAVINLLVGYTSTKVQGSDETVVQRRSFYFGGRSLDYTISGDFDLSSYNLRNLTIIHRDGKITNADLFAYLNSGIMKSNPYLRDGDLLTLRRTDTFAPKISISGAVKSGFTTDFRNDDTINHLITVAGGYAVDADTTHFFVTRIVNGKVEQIRVDNSPISLDQFILRHNDRIVIPRNEASRVNQSVWISGEVRMPGNYPIVENETTFDEVLSLAGNMTDRALPTAIFIERSQSNEFYEKFGWSELQVIRRSGNLLEESLEYIQQERSLATRFIFVNPQKNNKIEQVTLRDGDRIHVPRNDNQVLLMGQVKRTGYYPIYANYGVMDYIRLADGLTLAAELERIFIIKAGSRDWFRPGEVSIESGDIIFVDRNIVDNFQANRTYFIEKEQLRLQRSQQKLTTFQVILSAVATITSATLTYIALTKD
jgi:polysaccharide export outer membrane protein